MKYKVICREVIPEGCMPVLEGTILKDIHITRLTASGYLQILLKEKKIIAVGDKSNDFLPSAEDKKAKKKSDKEAKDALKKSETGLSQEKVNLFNKLKPADGITELDFVNLSKEEQETLLKKYEEQARMKENIETNLED